MNFALPIVSLGLVSALLAQNPAGVKDRDLKVRKLDDPTSGAIQVPRGYALIIGVATYQKLSAEENLRFPESDAEAVYRVLISQQGGAFPSENVHRLIGKQATLANIRYELEQWLPSVAKEQDRVIVYFAGHGFVNGGRGFLAPYDVEPNDFASTAYPMDALGKVLGEKVKAKWKVLLTDACHSGKITPETTDESIDAQISKLPATFLTFSATRERDKSYEDPKLSTGFGLFSYFLVQGWQGSADNSPCDGIVTADEMVEYVRTHVRAYARQRGVSQTPNERGDFDGNMVLGVSSQCAGAAPPPSATLGGLIVESNLDGVDVYLDDKLIGTTQKGKPLPIPGLATGLHTVKGFKKGYEPDTKEVMVVPGQDRSVQLRIQYAKEVKKSALDLVEQGEKLLFKRNSSVNLLAIYGSGKQTEGDIRQSRELFTKAMKEDGRYAKAAYDLAMACQLLSDSKCSLESFRQAVTIDPSYAEARVEFAGALIENGDPDEAVRQLTEALRLEPDNDVAYSHLSRAYLDKEVWDLSIEAADKAIALKPGNDQAHLWKGDALRRRAASIKDRAQRPPVYLQATESYRQYLALTNFSSPVHEKLAFYFIGFGVGSRKRADRQGVYAYQRSLAFLGLCDCEHKLGNLQRASDYCQRALKYDPNDATAYFLLGNVYRDLANRSMSRDYLQSARANYAKMIEINPDLELARNAKNYIEQIDRILPKLPR